VLQLLLPGVLGGMLLYVAIQHGLLAARLERLSDRALAAGVGAVTLLSGNLAVGLGAGVAVLAARRAVAALAGRRSALAPHPVRHLEVLERVAGAPARSVAGAFARRSGRARALGAGWRDS
jgi:hypothetical protein